MSLVLTINCNECHVNGGFIYVRIVFNVVQKKFRVYLAPFLHGMRYTSYGRHFTKVDKLKEVCI